MIVKPAIGFVQKDSDALLLTKAETIVDSMTGNPSYPSPTPSLAAITTAANEFSTAISDAANGGTTQTVIKNTKRAARGALLRELASYVTVACKGQMEDLMASGFPIQKPTRTPASVLPAPVAPVLSFGPRSGELAVSTTPLARAYTYNWRVALAASPAVSVQKAQTTAASIVFAGLTPGQIYAVEVNAVGSQGPSDWSDPSQLMVV